MAEQKFSRTSAYVRWGRLRNLAWIAPAAIFIVSAVMHAPAAFETAESAQDGALVLFTFVLADIIWALICGLIVSAAWLALCTFMRKRARREASFDATQDIEYYREKLTGASPALVSMLADLRIEPRKDLAATLLKLKMHKVIEFDNQGQARVIANAPADAAPSDIYLIEQIRTGGVASVNSSTWARMAEKEALATPYLKANKDARGERLGTVFYAMLMGFLVPMLVFIVSALLSSLLLVSPLGAGVATLIEDGSGTRELALAAQNDPLILVGFVLFVCTFFLGIFGSLYPMIQAISAIVSILSRTNDVSRTAAGDELSECVYGLRNWIRDFTNMPQSDRDAVTVWDDFFVYAVALDEDNPAIKEILPMKGFAARDIAYVLEEGLVNVAITAGDVMTRGKYEH